MIQRTFEEMVSYFNRTVADMDIDRKYKIALLGMITAILQKHDEDVKTIEPEPCEDAVSREEVMKLLCKETCHPGAFCPDCYCKEIREKVDLLERIRAEEDDGR